jgi:cyclase
MRSTLWHARRRVALGALASFVVSSVRAQASSNGAAAPNEPLGAQLVKTGLYLLTGGGTNSLLRLSAAGCVLVDGKRPGMYRPLMSQIRRLNKISDLPLRVVIFTNHHDDRSGNQAQFAAARVAVLAQANALKRLPGAALPLADARTASGPKGASFAFDRAHEFHMGSVPIRLLHFAPAYTDDDTVVYFPDLKTVALGNLYTQGPPMPDYAGGGSLLGWGPVLDQVLALDFDTAIPSDGASVTRADVAALRDRIGTLATRARKLVKAGLPRYQFLTQLRTDDLGWQFDPGREEADRIYEELARAP